MPNPLPAIPDEELERSWLRWLGYFELAGGALCAIGSLIPSLGTPSGLPLTSPLLGMLAGAVSAVAGWALIKQDARGVWLSFPVQAAQVLNFSMATRYVFVSGLRVALVMGSTGGWLSFSFGGQFYLSSKPTDGTLDAMGMAAEFHLRQHFAGVSMWSAAINFVALVYAIRLLWLLTGRTSRGKVRS